MSNSTLIYLDDLLNIDHFYFQQMVSQIYPTELQLSKENYFNTEAPIFDLDWCLINDMSYLK